jgi:hypothetical protein
VARSAGASSRRPPEERHGAARHGFGRGGRTPLRYSHQLSLFARGYDFGNGCTGTVQGPKASQPLNSTTILRTDSNFCPRRKNHPMNTHHPLASTLDAALLFVRYVVLAGFFASQLVLNALADGRTDSRLATRPTPNLQGDTDPFPEKPSQALPLDTAPRDATPSPDAQRATEELPLAKRLPARVRYRLEVEALDTLVRSRSDIQKRISDLDFKIKLARLLAKNAENNNVSEDEFDAAIAKDPQIQRAMLDLSDLQHQQRELEIAPKDQAVDSKIAQIKETINRLQKNIDEMKDQARTKVVEHIKRQGADSSANVQAVELEQSLLAAQLKGTSTQIEAQAERIQKSEKFTGEVDQLRDEIEQGRGVIKEMSNELSRRNIEIEAPSRVTILEAAGKAEVVQPARRPIVSGVAGFFAFLLGLMAIIFVRFLRRKRNASQEASTEATTLRRPNWGSSLFSALLLGAACGALVWYLLPTQSEASAFLRVSATTPSIWHGENGPDFESYRRNQMAMIKGNVVINKALDEKAVQDSPVIRRNSADPTNWLSENLSVEFPGNGELMKVSLRDVDPAGVTDIVNGVVTAFMKEVVDKERNDKLIRRDNLDKKLRNYKQQVLDKQRQLFEISQQLNNAE